MINAFEMLGLEPRPWLAGDVGRRAYQERARLLHPDAPSGDEFEFVRLGEAFAVVSDGARRLRALAGADGGGGAGQEGTDVDLFLEVGAALQSGRELGAKLAAAAGALERALLTRDVREGRRRLEAVGGGIDGRLAEVVGLVREMDRRWPEVTGRELRDVAARWERLAAWGREVAELRADLAGT